jgi:hypothetical protein
MQQSIAIGSELDRMIRRLGHSTAEITLLGVSAAALPVATLLSSLRAVANRGHMIGILPDNGVGVLGLSGLGGKEGVSLEDQFVPRLRTMLQLACDDTGFGPATVSFRSAKRRADELRDADDLLQILLDHPVRSFVVGTKPAMFQTPYGLYTPDARFDGLFQ